MVFVFQPKPLFLKREKQTSIETRVSKFSLKLFREIFGQPQKNENICSFSQKF